MSESKAKAQAETPPAEASPTESWAAKEIESLKPEPAPKGLDEKAIAAKVSAGLSRAQAIEVIEAQAAQDKPKK